MRASQCRGILHPQECYFPKKERASPPSLQEKGGAPPGFPGGAHTQAPFAHETATHIHGSFMWASSHADLVLYNGTSTLR